MDIKVTVTIEGLEELTNSITLLASAIGYGKGATQLVEMAKATEQVKAEKSEKAPEAPKEEKPKAPPKDVKKSEPAPPEEPEEVPFEPDTATDATAKRYVLADVRAKLAELSKDGKSAEVKKLIADAGADKLSDVDPSQYADLMAKAEAL